MGMTAENVARKYEVSRREQEVFAAESQRKAAQAATGGRFDDEIVPIRTVIAPSRATAAYGRTRRRRSWRTSSLSSWRAGR